MDHVDGAAGLGIAALLHPGPYQRSDQADRAGRLPGRQSGRQAGRQDPLPAGAFSGLPAVLQPAGLQVAAGRFQQGQQPFQYGVRDLGRWTVERQQAPPPGTLAAV